MRSAEISESNSSYKTRKIRGNLFEVKKNILFPPKPSPKLKSPINNGNLFLEKLETQKTFLTDLFNIGDKSRQA